MSGVKRRTKKRVREHNVQFQMQKDLKLKDQIIIELREKVKFWRQIHAHRNNDIFELNNIIVGLQDELCQLKGSSPEVSSPRGTKFIVYAE